MTAQEVYARAFDEARGRTPRSEPYRHGVRAGLEAAFDGKRLASPYEAGSAEADAFLAGVEEGRVLARLERLGRD